MKFKIFLSICLISFLGNVVLSAKDWNNPVDIGSSWKYAVSVSRDFDGDGDLDIIATGQKDNINNNYAGILYRNDGQGSFTEVTLNGLDIAPNNRKIISIDAGDFNGDGLDDIIYTFTDYNVWIYYVAVYTNNGDGSSWTEKLMAQGYNGNFSVADLDGDTDLDFVFSSYPTSKIYKFINDGNANFVETLIETLSDDIDPNTSTTFTARSVDLACFDIDNDNDVDIISIYYDNLNTPTRGVLQVLSNDGNGSFTETENWLDYVASNTNFNVGKSAVIIPFHLNADNNMDFIMAAGEYTWSYISDGAGSFTVNKTNVFDWALSCKGQFQIADVNDDLANDILIHRYNYSNGESVIMQAINNGNYTFTSSIINDANPLKGQPTAGNFLKPSTNDFLVADFDGDGFIDLNIFAATSVSTVTRYGGLFKTSCYALAAITNTTKISDTEYQFTADVNDNGCQAITDYGFVWSTTPNPTLSNNQGTVSLGSGNATHQYTISNLQTGPGYYVRAYATNAEGTSYSEAVNFGVVPTLPEWGLIILSIGLMLGGGWFVFKKVL